MYKHSYIADIFDKKIVEEEVVQFVPTEKTSNDKIDIFSWEECTQINKTEKKAQYTNHRSKIFCQCGTSVETVINREFFKEYSPDGDSWGYNQKDSEGKQFRFAHGRFEPVVCAGCSYSYSKNEEFIHIHPSGQFEENTVFSKFLCYENEKSITLYNFSRYVIVGIKKKNIIYKEHKTFLSYNKQKRCFFLYNGNKGAFKFMRIPLRSFYERLHNFLIHFVNASDKRMTDEQKEKFIIKPLIEYLTRIQTIINKNDVNEIEALFERLKSEMQSDFKSYNKNDEITDLNREFYKSFKFACEKIKVYSLLAVMPSFSTILFTKDLEFLRNLVTQYVMPGLTALQKVNPTSPVKIMRDTILLTVKMHNETLIKIVKSKDRFIKRKEKEAILKDAIPHVIIEKYKKQRPKEPPTPEYLKSRVHFSLGISKITSTEYLESFKITKGIYRYIKKPNEFSDFVVAMLSNDTKYFTFEDAYAIVEKYDYEHSFAIFTCFLREDMKN